MPIPYVALMGTIMEFFAYLGLIGYVSTWDTVAVIGKKSMYEEEKEEASEESNQAEVKKEPVQVESEAPAQANGKEETVQVEVEMKEMGNTETIACSVCSIRLVGTKRTVLANCG